jgi:hypothetical protein
MNQTPTPSVPAAPARAAVAVDVLAVLAAMQDQLDDLAAAIASQQSFIEALTQTVRRGSR